MLTRKATAKDMELKLKHTLEDLKAAKELNNTLLQEREDSECEIFKTITRNTELKNELAELHIKYSEIVDKCNHMQDFIQSFRECSDTDEQTLSRITDLEISLSLAQKSVLELEQENKNITEEKHSQFLFSELQQCDSAIYDKSISVYNNLNDKSNK